MDALKSFKTYLSRHDLKSTPERLTVLKEVLNCNSHFDPDTLFFRLKSQHKKISRATIYRTLDLLIDSGLLKKINFSNQTTRYEMDLRERKHDHFLCLECGRIIEVWDNDLHKIHQNIATKYKFKIIDYTHQLYGKCSVCREKTGNTGN